MSWLAKGLHSLPLDDPHIREIYCLSQGAYFELISIERMSFKYILNRSGSSVNVECR